MRENVRGLVAGFSKNIELKDPIVEIGSFQVSGQEGFADMRPFFPGKTYLGCDMRPGVGVDQIENVHNLSFASESIGTVIMLDTLEHVENPFISVAEILRVLKPGGFLLMTSVMLFPIHDYPSDYWRFTPNAFKLLLANYDLSVIGYQGEPSFPHTVIGLGAKKPYSNQAILDFKAATANITYI
jgi:SAM-dependent methyltransferase